MANKYQENSGDKTIHDRSTLFPSTKVKLLMKSAPNPGLISNEAVLVTAHAAKLFLAHMAKTASDQSNEQDSELLYRDLANTIQNCEEFEFLKEIVPRKIKVKDLLITKPAFANESTPEKGNSSES